MEGRDQLVEASGKKTFTLYNPATTAKLADGRKSIHTQEHARTKLNDI